MWWWVNHREMSSAGDACINTCENTGGQNVDAIEACICDCRKQAGLPPGQSCEMDMGFAARTPVQTPAQCVRPIGMVVRSILDGQG
jgi:hypothetical protein